jgi:cytochrome c5
VRCCVGLWRGARVAVRLAMFRKVAEEVDAASVAAEAAVSGNLSHPNVASTYHHSVLDAAPRAADEELWGSRGSCGHGCSARMLPPSGVGSIKLLLLQVLPACGTCARLLQPP